jgi:hypothetical protein
VSRSLMLGMVPGMFDRLSLRQTADGKDAEHQEDRQVFEGAAFHRNTTIVYFSQCYRRPSRPVKTAFEAAVYLVYRVCLVCSVHLVRSPKHTRQTE